MFHGIEELRKDGRGYVYWRGVQVEHYSFGDRDEDLQREAEAARALAKTCRTIEARGEGVSAYSISFQQMWDSMPGPEWLQWVAIGICVQLQINGICTPAHIINTVLHEMNGGDPYGTFEDPRYIYVKTDDMGRRCDAWHFVTEYRNPDHLSIDALRMVTDRPWRGACATSGATMRDFAELLMPIQAEDWMKRAAVSLCRSYASNIRWRTSLVDLVKLIQSGFQIGHQG